MPPLRYAGPVSSDGSMIGLKQYADAAALQGLSQTDVDARISSLITPYSTVDYVDTQDAKYASGAYVQQQDNTKLKLAAKGAANGVATLDSAGMIPASQIDLGARSDGWLYSAGAYNSGTVTVSSTSAFTLVATMTISRADWNAGVSHYAFIWGYWEVRGITGTARPVIEVRQGGTTGTLVAKGMGSSRGDYHPCNVMPFQPLEIKPASSITYYAYARIVNSGSVEFTGSSSGGVASPPNMVGLISPGSGVSL